MSNDSMILWFRQDLRLTDNPALHAASLTDLPILFVYVDDETMRWRPGGASRWWLHHSLESLKRDLHSRFGARLCILKGAAAEIIPELCREVGATHVFWNRCYEPEIIQRDAAIKDLLLKNGIDCQSFNGSLLKEPWEVQNKAGASFKVFSPFWKTLRRMKFRHAYPIPNRLNPANFSSGLALEDLGLLPRVPWDKTMQKIWAPGESGAGRRLSDFLDNGLSGYKELRNRPDLNCTSRLSPHLHLGEISPLQIWHSMAKARNTRRFQDHDIDHFLSELGWREFSSHLLYHHPSLPHEPIRKEFQKFPWSGDEKALKSWQKGLTGFPIVDAGMRELWATGWMHNRVRMIAASFLVKDLLIPWQRGEEWFWDTLVDADLANNSSSWQWVAGCGADAAPYFRIFNPLLQGKKFDPYGHYVAKWVPELRKLPPEIIHSPWEAEEGLLNQSGVRLGQNYSYPIVDHIKAREQALHSYEKIKGHK